MSGNPRRVAEVYRIARRLAGGPGLSTAALARAARMSPQSARRWILRLAKEGTIERTGSLGKGEKGRNAAEWRLKA